MALEKAMREQKEAQDTLHTVKDNLSSPSRFVNELATPQKAIFNDIRVRTDNVPVPAKKLFADSLSPVQSKELAHFKEAAELQERISFCKAKVGANAANMAMEWLVVASIPLLPPVILLSFSSSLNTIDGMCFDADCHSGEGQGADERESAHVGVPASSSNPIQ